MTKYRGVESQLQSFLTSALVGGEYLQKPVLIEDEAGKGKNLFSYAIRTPNSPFRGLVSIPTTLRRHPKVKLFLFRA
jgi:hypothetical protein